MLQVVKSVSIPLLLFIWVFSFTYAGADDSATEALFSWVLKLRGDNPATYTGTFINTVRRERSGIVSSPRRDVGGMNTRMHIACSCCCPYEYQVFETISQISFLESPTLPSEQTPFWVFSQPSQSEGVPVTIARHTLRGETSECVSCSEVPSANVCDGDDNGNWNPCPCLMCWLCFSPVMLATNAWALLCGHRTRSRSERRPYFLDSTPESSGDRQDVSISDVSLAGGATHSDRQTPSLLPTSTRVIHLVESDYMTQQWLQQIIHEGRFNESFIVIPGFLHTPVRVFIYLASPNDQNPYYSICLVCSGSHEVDTIRMEVSITDQPIFGYRIEQLRFEGENMNLTIDRLDQVIRSQPQLRNMNSQPFTSLLGELPSYDEAIQASQNALLLPPPYSQ